MLSPEQIREVVRWWPEELREEFEERAGVVQFEGKVELEAAERLAFYSLCRRLNPEEGVLT